jgi:2,5-furandicarboxylate decarboxylase 1
MTADLASYLRQHAEHHVTVHKQVTLHQIGALTAQAAAPIVFEDIAGFAGWRLVDQLFVNRAAQSRVLGCDPAEVVPRLAQVLEEGPRPLRMVADAACQANVLEGDDIDLGQLPVVTHTPMDPYPYTTSFAIHRDPETGALNQMNPRAGVMGPKKMVTSFVTSTANNILAKHRAANTPMPQAIVIGAHPAWELAGVYSHPHKDWWELELFEGISGQVGDMVRCKTVDLVVPADASVVIEGFVDPVETAQDGPSPGPTMLFTPFADQQPVFNITAITMSDTLIYRNHMMTPFTDHQELPRLFHEAVLFSRLQAMGIRVHDVTFPNGGGALLCVIQIEPTMDGQSTDALLSVLGSTFMNAKMVVAVDPDINIHDPRELEYALATRVDPSKDVVIINNSRGWPFDPTARPVLEAGERTAHSRFPALVGRWGIDATKPVPYHHAERALFERAWPLHWGEVNLSDYL